MRDILSYDDIASQAPEQGQSSNYSAESGSPPKKRRKNNRQRNRNHPTGDNGYTDNHHKSPPKNLRRDYGLKEESRTLTHEEVWDDSALIRAWDAAIEEYEVLNGPGQKWKSEPVNKSALWFNIPPEEEEPSESPGPTFLMPVIPPNLAVKSDESHQLGPADPDNSQPVNFDTFVPRHDPVLSQVDEMEDKRSHASKVMSSSTIPPNPPGVSGHVSKDEAFQQAIGAWYWAGYWSGVYHSIGNSAQPDEAVAGAEGDAEYEGVENATGGHEREQEEDIVIDGSSSDEARADEDDLLPT